jgi:outer membrane protein OmpA-like peptidoglycan-associated protein
MPANTMWKRTVVAVLGVAIAMTGCSAGSPGPGPEAAVAVGSAAWSAQCDQVAAMPTTAATGLLAVVTDLTSSQRALQSAPALNEALAAAQKVGWALIAVGVNGSGGTPGMVGPMLLDPSGGQDSVTGDRARVIGLGCAEALLDRNELKPTSAGSDQLAAIAAALRQKPDAMVISSDGVPVGGLLDINTLGWEPDVASAVDQVIASPVTLPPAALPITWVDLAETSEPMPDAARATLTQLWQAVLGAEKAVVTIDTRLGPVASAAPIADPADAFTVPLGTVITTASGAQCANIPSALLFGADSAKIIDPSALADIITALTAHPDWRADIVGHTADYGSEAGRAELSRARAAAVATTLVAGGVTNHLDTQGVGATLPIASEWPLGARGPHDQAAASLNRRVEITYGTADQLAAGARC